MEYQQGRFQCFVCSEGIPPIAPRNYVGFGWPPCLQCGHVLCQQCLEDACLDGNCEMCTRCADEREMTSPYPLMKEYVAGKNPLAAFSSKDRGGGRDHSLRYQNDSNYGSRPGRSLGSSPAFEMLKTYHMEALAIVNDHFNATVDALEQSHAAATERLWETFEQYSKLVIEDRDHRTPASDGLLGSVANNFDNRNRPPTTSRQTMLCHNYAPQDDDSFLAHVSMNSVIPESYSTRVDVGDSFTRKANSGPKRSGQSHAYEIKSVGESFAANGAEVDGQVLEVQSLSAFYVQPRTPQLETLKQIQIYLNRDDDQNEVNLYLNPKKGDLCAAKWSVDQIWYRALIEYVEPSDHFRVFFVDFGSREVLHVSSLRSLDTSLATLPAQAVLCSLARIRPAKLCRQWSQFAVGAFTERALKKDCRLRVTEVRGGTVGRLGGGRKEYVLYVELFVDGDSVNDEFVQRLLAVYVNKAPRESAWERAASESQPAVPEPVPAVIATPTVAPVSSFSQIPGVPVSPTITPESSPRVPEPVPIIPRSGRREVKLLSFNSPGNFTLHFADAGHDPLFFHSTLLAVHSSLPQAAVVKCGRFYSVWNETEGNFYRGRALSDEKTGESSIKLDLIDAGMYLTVDKQHVKELPQHLCQNEPQTIRCCLSGIQPAGGVSKWTQASCERFTQLVTSSVRIFVQFDDADEEPFQRNVRLYGRFSSSDEEELVCVNDLLVSDGLGLRKRAQENKAAAVKLTDGRPSKEEKKPVPRLSHYLQSTEWLSPEPLTEKDFAGYVTWINEHGYAYVQHSRTVTSLETISTALEAQYSRTQPEENLVLKPGEACIARYSGDQLWYRGSVVRVDDASQRALVLFCDYGNKEELPFSELRRRLTCTNFPIQANKCLLSNIQPPGGNWTEEFAETVHSLLSGKCCQIEIEQFGTVPKISVFMEDGTPLRDLLDSPGLGAEVPVGRTGTSIASSDNDSDTVNVLAGNSSMDSAAPFKEFRIPEVNRLFPVTVLQVLTNWELILKPAKFPEGNLDQSEAQWNQQIIDFENADSFIQNPVLSLKSDGQAEPGSLCIAWDQTGRKWSRALVKETGQAGSVLVEMIDTMQIVSLPAAYLRTIRWSLCDAPRNAIKATLTEFPASPAAASLLEGQLRNRLHWARFNGGKFDWSVDLFVNRNSPPVSIYASPPPSGISGTAIPRARRLF